MGGFAAIVFGGALIGYAFRLHKRGREGTSEAA
jgi:hypothetical protein